MKKKIETINQHDYAFRFIGSKAITNGAFAYTLESSSNTQSKSGDIQDIINIIYYPLTGRFQVTHTNALIDQELQAEIKNEFLIVHYTPISLFLGQNQVTSLPSHILEINIIMLTASNFTQGDVVSYAQELGTCTTEISCIGACRDLL